MKTITLGAATTRAVLEIFDNKDSIGSATGIAIKGQRDTIFDILQNAVKDKSGDDKIVLDVNDDDFAKIISMHIAASHGLNEIANRMFTAIVLSEDATDDIHIGTDGTASRRKTGLDVN